MFLRAVYALIREEERIPTYSILLEMFQKSFQSPPAPFEEP